MTCPHRLHLVCRNTTIRPDENQEILKCFGVPPGDGSTHGKDFAKTSQAAISIIGRNCALGNTRPGRL